MEKALPQSKFPEYALNVSKTRTDRLRQNIRPERL